MATLPEILIVLAPLFAKIKLYNGETSPDEFYHKVSQIFVIGSSLDNGNNSPVFTDSVKTDILKSRIGRRFFPIPNNINTPQDFQKWLQNKYSEVS